MKDHAPLILLVEDDELMRQAIRFVLAATGYEVLEAKDGQEGLEVFAQQPDAIDLVLSDLMMPRMSGLEMLQELRQLRPHIKLILVTGLPADGQAWREQGVYDWHSKSSAHEQLLSKVAAALSA